MGRIRPTASRSKRSVIQHALLCTLLLALGLAALSFTPRHTHIYGVAKGDGIGDHDLDFIKEDGTTSGGEVVEEVKPSEGKYVLGGTQEQGSAGTGDGTEGAGDGAAAEEASTGGSATDGTGGGGAAADGAAAGADDGAAGADDGTAAAADDGTAAAADDGAAAAVDDGSAAAVDDGSAAADGAAAGDSVELATQAADAGDAKPQGKAGVPFIDYDPSKETEWMAQPAADSGIPGLRTPAGSDKYHVLVTTNGGVYVQWQARVCYYWYKKIKAQYPDSAMGGFTRILHSGNPDPYMEEIPTVVVDPMPADVAAVAKGYVVLERPLAFQQWVAKHAASIPEKYILMGEPDHVFVLPPPLWATPTQPAAFPFFYITPKENEALINRFNPKQVPIDQFEPIGNSPVMIYKDQFASIVDSWVNISIALKSDPAADKAFGWVLEMYAYSIASAQAETGPIRYNLRADFMAQPPWDEALHAKNGAPYRIIHFTYGNDFNPAGVFTPGKVGAWHFDKRDYTGSYPPVTISQPPVGCKNMAVRRLISSINEASHTFADWEARGSTDVQ